MVLAVQASHMTSVQLNCVLHAEEQTDAKKPLRETSFLFVHFLQLRF